MFSFFSSKPALKDLIPEGYVDIHSHLLPGIDDGARTIDDTRQLIDAMRELGFGQFVTTPHVMTGIWENTTASIEETLLSTVDLLKSESKSVTLHAGAEYLVDSNFMKLFQNEPLRTIRDNFVLVEMSYINPPIQLYEILFELQLAGYTPILAHPERYTFYNINYPEYRKLKNAGCLFQLNLLTAVGMYGDWPMQTANKLLQEGMIDFTGSDIHNLKHVRAFDKRVQLKEVKLLEVAIANNQKFYLQP